MIQHFKRFIPKKFIKEIKKYRDLATAKVMCPICKSRFTKFASFGINDRENAQCINCGSLERHRLLWKYLNTETDIFKSSKKSRLLHFAPEKFFYESFSAKSNSIDYIPCDLSPEIYNYRGRVKVEKVDITNIPFEENYFDAILCNHVLEHIPDDKLAMEELYRVMKKGGWGIFQVPLDYERDVTYEDFSIVTPEEREKAFGQEDHVRWYGRDYKKRLARAGFQVTEDDYVKQFSSKELMKYGFNPTELIYFCQK